MGTMNLGTLWVRLNADSKNLSKGLSDGAARVEKFAKETKKLSNEVAGVSGMLLALGGAAVKLAASVDGQAARSMANLERNTKLVAVQVADVLRPAVDGISSSFKRAADFIAGLSPETKKQISQWAVWVAQLAVAAKVIAVVAGLVDGVAGAFAALFSAIAAVGVGPILGIVAAVATVIAVVLLLHRAWRTNWNGIQDVTQEVFNNLGKAAKWLADLFKRMWVSIIDGAEKAVIGLITVAEKIAALAGKKLDTSGLREGLSGLFNDLRSGDFFTGALQFAKGVAKDLADTLTTEMKIIRDQVAKAIGFGGGGKAQAHARGPSGLGPAGPFKSGALSGAMPAGINAGASFVHEMDKQAKAIEKAAADEKKARDLQLKAVLKATSDEQRARRLALAAQSGNLNGLTKDEKRAVRKDDTSKTWGELNKAQKNIGNFARRVGGIVMQGLGALGETVNAIAQGAQAGGIWGAMIAAVMEVFKRMESFQQMLKILEYGLVRLGEFLEPLFGPLFEFIGKATAVGTEILAPLFEALVPIFQTLADALNDLMPFMVLVGFLFKAIAPIIKALATVLSITFKVLQPVFRILFEIARVILIVILTVLDAIIQVWNGLLDTLADIVEFVVNLFTMGRDGAAAAAEVRKAKGDRLNDDIAELAALNFDQAQAIADNTAATWDATIAQREAAGAAAAVAESLSNVPSGYKIALSRFRATDGEARYVAALDAGRAGSEASWGGAGGGGGMVIEGDLNVSLPGADLASMNEELQRYKERRRAQVRGNPLDPRGG